MIGVHDLAVYLLSAMNVFTPMSDHLYYEPHSITQARYEQVAEDLATVALDPKVKPLFKGDSGRIKTGLLFAVMVSDESSYRDDVMSCKKLGDGGVSYGPYQSQSYPDTVCQNIIQATWVAIDMIEESFRICHKLPQNYWLSEYTDGNNWHSERAHNRSSYRIDRALNYYSTHKMAN